MISSDIIILSLVSLEVPNVYDRCGAWFGSGRARCNSPASCSGRGVFARFSGARRSGSVDVHVPLKKDLHGSEIKDGTMRRFPVLVRMSVILLLAFCGAAQGAAINQVQSTIKITNVQTYCSGDQPWVHFRVNVNPEDAGKPGLLYVGAHDPSQRVAQFYIAGAWVQAASTMFPPYAVARGGLYSMDVDAPLNDPDTRQGWIMYAGYGVLTAADESKVQQAIAAVAIAREKFPGRNIPGVDPDHHRRVFIQDNMTKGGKFQVVRQWSPDIQNLCVAVSGG